MIIVEAAPDPVQKALRQTKKVWNKQVSSFIDDLLDFKKMMNGQPSKFFKQKSFIKDPIPNDPISIISHLAGSFQELAQQGNNIVQQQLNYSKTRKKKQPKRKGQGPVPSPSPMETPVVAPPGGVDLSKQLAAEIDAYELVTLGSTPVSRFFARLLSPGIGSSPKAKIRRYRMSLLKSALEVYKDLNKLQAAITGSSPESIFEAGRLLSKIEGNWHFFKTGLGTYKKSGATPTDQGGKISFSDSKIDAIIADYRENAPALKITKKNRLISYIIKYKKIIDAGSKSVDLPKLQEIIEVIQEEYNKILLELNIRYKFDAKTLQDLRPRVEFLEHGVMPEGPPIQPKKVVVAPKAIPVPVNSVDDIIKDYKYAANFLGLDPRKLYTLIGEYRLNKDQSKIPQIMEEYRNVLSAANAQAGSNAGSLREAWEVKKKKASDIADGLEALGQQTLEKWFGKLKHQLSPFDKTSAHRLEIYQIAKACRETINSIMDSLESGLNVEILEKLSAEVDKSFKEIQYLSSGLETTLRGKGFDKPFMDLLESGKITQFSPDLDPKQREHLKKMIERRRLTDLTKLYQGHK